MTTRERLILAAPFLGVPALAVLAPSDDGPTVCPIALATGLACPGCGMARAASSLIRGDVAGAVGYHPLVMLVVALGVISWAWLLLHKLGKVGTFPPRVLKATFATTAILLAGVWVLRLMSGTLPPV